MVIALLGFGYGAIGYRDAVHHANAYGKQADRIIADGRGPDALGAERLEQLIKVQDPGFWEHGGIDLSTEGAGLTTISQSLSKRLGFDAFRPGIGKIRQTGFAFGLEKVSTRIKSSHSGLIPWEWGVALMGGWSASLRQATMFTTDLLSNSQTANFIAL
ncbi:MAG: hypothetical protein P8O11_01595 [Lentibacter sp.]|nr:hypothetical protein [Lentibacter sp.]MDG1288402.1 hypothetical protein [Lentibacter sp.]